MRPKDFAVTIESLSGPQVLTQSFGLRCIHNTKSAYTSHNSNLAFCLHARMSLSHQVLDPTDFTLRLMKDSPICSFVSFHNSLLSPWSPVNLPEACYDPQPTRIRAAWILGEMRELSKWAKSPAIFSAAGTRHLQRQMVSNIR